MQKTASRGLLEIITKSAAPGILIFDLKNTLVYINPAAYTILSPFIRSSRSKQNRNHIIPREVYHFCDRLKQSLKTGGKGRMKGSISLMTMRHHLLFGTTYTLRGTFLHDHQQSRNGGTKFLMVIMELTRGMNLEKAKKLA